MFAILRIRDFGLLWVAGLFSIAGDFALLVVLPLHIYRLTDSTLATAGVLAAGYLPRVVIGSIAGVFVDRWDRKRIMVVADLSRAVLLLPILAAPDNLAALYAVAAIHGTIGLFFTPAENALLPKLVGEQHLVAANALNSLNNNFAMLFGPAAGALLYAEAGIGGVAIADAATYVVSAVLIGLLGSDARPERAAEPATGGAAWVRMVADWRSGIALVRRNQTLRVLFAASTLGGIAQGVFLTLGLSPLVLDVLGGSPAQVGWLGAAQAVGGLIAGVVVVRFGHRFTKRWLLGGGMVGLGLCDFGAFNAHRIASPGTASVAVAMGWMSVAGVPAVASISGRLSLVQEQTTDAYRGRVFGALGSVQGIALLFGLAAGGVLGDAIGLVPVLSVSAWLRILGGLVVLAFLRRLGSSRRPATPAVDASDPSGRGRRQPDT